MQDGIDIAEYDSKKLSLPVFDLNDVFFANFFQETFGRAGEDNSGEVWTMFLYAGIQGSVHESDEVYQKKLTLIRILKVACLSCKNMPKSKKH